MDFRLNEEQKMLQDTLSRLIRSTYSFEQREEYGKQPQGFSEDFWAQVAEIGLTGVPFAEEHGGLGGKGVELLVIMTELGRGLCLEPYLQSIVLGGGLLSQLGSSSQQADLLPDVAAGSRKLAVGLQEPQSHYNLNDVKTLAKRNNQDFIINGRKSVVISGHCADTFIVSARTAGEQLDKQGISLFLLDPNSQGITRRDYITIDGIRACDLVLDNVVVPAANLLGEEGNSYDAIHYQAGRAIAALCAEAVGAMEEAVNITLEYLKTRKQFGTPIGKFQALQHRMVDMCTELEQAKSMATLAACVCDDVQSNERQRNLAAAKQAISRASKYIAEEAIQLHGGIGMTWEYSLAHYAKRLVMLTHQFGDADHHLQHYTELMTND